MVHDQPALACRRAELLRWAASIGAVTAEAVAELQQSSVSSASAQLSAAGRARQLSRHRPLSGRPALYAVTRAGLADGGLQGLDPCRVSASNAAHLIACAWTAARLARSYPDQRIAGERELRRDERALGRPLASATVRGGVSGQPRLHRPDLVLWPQARLGSGDARCSPLPVAIEVELTVKAPRRLAEICRAWARCRLVAGVLYLAAAEVDRALERALAETDAGARVVVVPLQALG